MTNLATRHGGVVHLADSALRLRLGHGGALDLSMLTVKSWPGGRVWEMQPTRGSSSTRWVLEVPLRVAWEGGLGSGLASAGSGSGSGSGDSLGTEITQK